MGGVVTESLNTLIITIKFDDTNYLTWSKSVIDIHGRDYEEYLTGKAKKHSKDDLKYRKWKTDNAMVMG